MARATRIAAVCGVAAAVVLNLAAPAGAAAVTGGDLVVYRVGTGTAGLTSSGTAAFLDEYTTSGSLVQTIALPTADAGSVHALVSSGTATSEGLLTLSPSGQYVGFTGYDTTPGTASVAGTTSAAVPRTVGLLNVATGTVDTSTALTDFASANNPRSAVTSDGTSLWVGGAAGGVRSASLGGTTSTQLSTTVANIRQVNIFSGQLYVSDSSGTAIRLGAVGSGLPTTAGQTITNLAGFETSTGSPYAYLFATLKAGDTAFDTVYVADDAAGQGIQKWSLVSGSWVLDGVITATGARGLTGVVSGTTVSLYATTGGSAAAGGGTLWSVSDTAGWDAPPSTTTPTVIATAANDESFRGVALIPVGSPPVLPESPWALGLPLSGGAVILAGVAVIVRRRRVGRPHPLG